MFSVAPAAVLGFVVGLRHAMDVDHVAAVGTIVARERDVRSAALIGAAWGIGHALTLLLVGGVILACGLVVPQRVGLALELGVGVMLLGLGVWNSTSRSHRHGDAVPAPSSSAPWIRRLLCPLLVGGVHGLAGSAAAVLLAIAAGRALGLAYLLVFGIGTTFGMVVLTTALALPIGRAQRRFGRGESWLRVGAGALSFVVGALLIYEVGWSDIVVP